MSSRVLLSGFPRSVEIGAGGGVYFYHWSDIPPHKTFMKRTGL